MNNSDLQLAQTRFDKTQQEFNEIEELMHLRATEQREILSRLPARYDADPVALSADLHLKAAYDQLLDPQRGPLHIEYARRRLARDNASRLLIECKSLIAKADNDLKIAEDKAAEQVAKVDRLRREREALTA